MGTGIDFGTTNSVLSVSCGKSVKVTSFSDSSGNATTFRSLLYVPENETIKTNPLILTGPPAIERYLEEQGGGRLIKSPKSFLASSFTGTQIGPRNYTIAELVAMVISGLRKGAEEQFGLLPTPIVVGRPVRFVRDGNEDKEALAVERLTHAFKLAGFPTVTFEYEPVAAAYTYESHLKSDQILFVADLGGGTSDFCVMKVGPNARNSPAQERILGTGGVGIAGDNFDGSLLDALVTPKLGKGTYYCSMSGKLEIPHWIYSYFCSWSKSILLRDRGNRRILEEIRVAAEDREAVARLCEIVDENLMFYLQQAVGKTKNSLSDQPKGILSFNVGPELIEEEVLESDFSNWISRHLMEIELAITETLARSNVKADEIDRVFATGGSSLVPAVQRLLKRIFGADKISGGGEFTSVAAGLALAADSLP